ncbi:MAG TPA: hypothetical protein VG733_11130, partial [Chthoniobacteraceae bacterium]|nr:hypothetical protein [Chthoniobacteraceae bacterium]
MIAQKEKAGPCEPTPGMCGDQNRQSLGNVNAGEAAQDELFSRYTGISPAINLRAPKKSVREKNKLERCGAPIQTEFSFIDPKSDLKVGGGGFDPIPEWVHHVPKITPCQVLVYAAMVRRSRSGVFYGSLREISKAINRDYDTVKDAAAGLNGKL